MTLHSAPTKCLFPAAGYGTRFLPFTKAIPKEMLPILNKPLMQYGVEEAYVAGMRHIAIVTGRGKRAIEDHFDINYELEHEIEGLPSENKLVEIRKLIDSCTFSYTRQRQMKGLGHAILTGETLIGNEPCGVILSDDLCVPRLGEAALMSQMVDIYRRMSCVVLAVQTIGRSNVDKYGIVEVGKSFEGIYEVKSMIEKPSLAEAPSDLGIIGRYILVPEIFTILRDIETETNGEIHLTDALERFVKTEKVVALEFKGKRFDCGNVDGFIGATSFMYDVEQNACQQGC